MEIRTTVRFQPWFRSDEDSRSITLPWPVSTAEQSQVVNHINHIQWFAKDFGGIYNEDHSEWRAEFEPDEFKCVLRYLRNTKFNLREVFP